MKNKAGHRSGFVNIIGLPNAGKSTLTNALLGMQLNIINPKPQTTRHRIHAILNGEDHQIIIADTPGFIKDPEYSMQESMNQAALSVMEDADILLFMHDITSPRSESMELFDMVKKNYEGPIFLLLSKIDKVKDPEVIEEIEHWKDLEGITEIIPVSATNGYNLKKLLELILKAIPEHPPYYEKDYISDRSERFFVEEIIRNEILQQFSKEIPYSCEVVVNEFKEDGTSSGKTLIRAVIFVLRNSQRRILIGKGGQAIKQLGMNARKKIEKFTGSEVYLDLTVKIRENWRDSEKDLKKLGY
ncbi:MAG: GTPase Era [Saprospiraceae bacterium]|nr:GTPase Era [Saprospiraceae bacterium]